MRILVSLYIVILLSGCVGIMNKYSTGLDKDNTYLEFEEKYPFISLEMDKSSVENLWGKPDTVKTLNNGNEVWAYPYKTSWKGSYLWAIIMPLPIIILPVGDLNFLVEFEDDNIVTLSREYNKLSSYAACGPGIWLSSDLTRFCVFD